MLSLVACAADGVIGPSGLAADTSAPRRGYLHLPSGPIVVPYIETDGLAMHDDIVLGTVEEVAREWSSGKPYGGRDDSGGARAAGRQPLGNILDQSGGGNSNDNGTLRKWPGYIFYKFDTTFTAAEKDVVYQGLNKWMAGIDIPILECQPYWNCPYLVFFRRMPASNPQCGRSSVGKKSYVSNVPFQYVDLKIADAVAGSCSNVVEHEVGHLLGLYHEHQRADRDTYITVPPSKNVAWNVDGDWGIGTDTGTGQALISTGRYDYRSIMHYSSTTALPIKLADGRPLPGYVGTTATISNGDFAAVTAMNAGSTPAKVDREVAYVNQLYESAHSPTNELEVNTGPGAASLKVGANTISVEAMQAAANRALYTRQRIGTDDWSPWEYRGGVLHSAPGVAIKPTGGFVAVVVGSDDLTICMHDGWWDCDAGSWGGGWPAGVYPLNWAAPAVSVTDIGQTWIIVNTRGGTLYANVRLSDNTWNGWFNVGITDAQGAPALLPGESGWGNLFWVSSRDGGVHSNGALLAFEGDKPPVPGVTIQSGLAVVSRKLGTGGTDRHYDIFVVDQRRMIWTRSKKSGGWTGWKRVGGPAYTLPAVTMFYAEQPHLPLDLLYGGPFGLVLSDGSVFDPPIGDAVSGLNDVLWRQWVWP